MDFKLKIYNYGKYLFTIGGYCMNYDDVKWREIYKIMKIKNADKMNVKKLRKIITNKHNYWMIAENPDSAESLDIGTKVLHLTETLGDYMFEAPCTNDYIDIVDDNGILKARDEEGDIYDIPYVYFNNIELLSKKDLTYDEYYELLKLIKVLICKYEFDSNFIMNDRFGLTIDKILIGQKDKDYEGIDD